MIDQCTRCKKPLEESHVYRICPKCLEQGKEQKRRHRERKLLAKLNDPQRAGEEKARILQTYKQCRDRQRAPKPAPTIFRAIELSAEEIASLEPDATEETPYEAKRRAALEQIVARWRAGEHLPPLCKELGIHGVAAMKALRPYLPADLDEQIKRLSAKGMNDYQIADHFRLNRMLVRKRIAKLGIIPGRPGQLRPYTDAEVVAMYVNSQMSLAAIAREFNVYGKRGIRNALIRSGVPLRSADEQWTLSCAP